MYFDIQFNQIRLNRQFLNIQKICFFCCVLKQYIPNYHFQCLNSIELNHIINFPPFLIITDIRRPLLIINIFIDPYNINKIIKNSKNMDIIDRLLQQVMNDPRIPEVIIQDHKIFNLKSNLHKNDFHKMILDYCGTNEHLNLTKQPSMRTISKNLKHKYRQSWRKGEYQVFVYMAIFYSLIKHKEIIQFDLQQKSFLYSVFYTKEHTFIDYHLINLLKNEKNRKLDWCQEEEKLLVDTIQEMPQTGQWLNISYNLFKQSRQMFFRNAQQCREKWFNHLHPSIKKDKWTIEEDRRLFQLVQTYGTRWSAISKEMETSRNQHMVKNRYNSLTKKFKKHKGRLSLDKMLEKCHETTNTTRKKQKTSTKIFPTKNSQKQSQKNDHISSKQVQSSIQTQQKAYIYTSQESDNYNNFFQFSFQRQLSIDIRTENFHMKTLINHEKQDFFYNGMEDPYATIFQSLI